MKHLLNKNTNVYKNELNETLINDYDNNLYLKFDNQYNHIYNNINLIENETKDSLIFIDLHFKLFIQNYLEIINFKKRNNLDLENVISEIKIMKLYNRLLSYIKDYNINLTMYLDSLKYSLECNKINTIDIETYLKDIYNIDRYIESIDIFFKQYFSYYDIDLTKKFEFENILVGFFIKDKTTKNNTLINEPQTSNNSNADTGDTGELTQYDLNLIKNADIIEIGYIIKKYVSGKKNNVKCNFFVSKMKLYNIEILYNSIYSNTSKYTPIANFEKERKDLITLIQKIFN